MSPAGEATRSRRDLLIAFSGIMLATLLAALDQTIVATALPTIVGELGDYGIREFVDVKSVAVHTADAQPAPPPALAQATE